MGNPHLIHTYFNEAVVDPTSVIEGSLSLVSHSACGSLTMPHSQYSLSKMQRDDPSRECQVKAQIHLCFHRSYKISY